MTGPGTSRRLAAAQQFSGLAATVGRRSLKRATEVVNEFVTG